MNFKYSTLTEQMEHASTRHINAELLPSPDLYMMNCPNCGAIMIWLNGSVLHDPPVKQYECRDCRLFVVKYQDGNYEVVPVEQGINQQDQTE
jgi:predicted RNA-binding Zn-ribbon protein involved in translation (DUF1610 family)